MKKSGKSNKKLVKELQDIKKLLIFHLLKLGTNSNEIRSLFKISGSEFKKIIPNKKIKRYG